VAVQQVSGLAQWQVTWLIEHSTSHQLLWWIDPPVGGCSEARHRAKRQNVGGNAEAEHESTNDLKKLQQVLQSVSLEMQLKQESVFRHLQRQF